MDSLSPVNTTIIHHLKIIKVSQRSSFILLSEASGIITYTQIKYDELQHNYNCYRNVLITVSGKRFKFTRAAKKYFYLVTIIKIYCLIWKIAKSWKAHSFKNIEFMCFTFAHVK